MRFMNLKFGGVNFKQLGDDLFMKLKKSLIRYDIYFIVRVIVILFMDFRCVCW